MKNLQEVAGYFFFSIGSIYFLLALFVYYQMYYPHSQIIFNVLDIPFAFVALLYGASSLSVSLEENDIHSKGAEIGIFLVAFLAFVAVLGVNILFRDIL